jgi:hypothetical protein
MRAPPTNARSNSSIPPRSAGSSSTGWLNSHRAPIEEERDERDNDRPGETAQRMNPTEDESYSVRPVEAIDGTPILDLKAVMDVRTHSGLAGNGLVGREMPDHVTTAVCEARLVSIAAHAPPEDSFVERRQPTCVTGRNPQVGDATDAEDAWVGLAGRRQTPSLNPAAASASASVR